MIGFPWRATDATRLDHAIDTRDSARTAVVVPAVVDGTVCTLLLRSHSSGLGSIVVIGVGEEMEFQTPLHQLSAHLGAATVVVPQGGQLLLVVPTELVFGVSFRILAPRTPLSRLVKELISFSRDRAFAKESLGIRVGAAGSPTGMGVTGLRVGYFTARRIAGRYRRMAARRGGYDRWFRTVGSTTPAKAAPESVAGPPLGIVMPIYDPSLEDLAEAVHSVTDQSDPNWRLVLSNDGSPDPGLVHYLDALAASEPRITVLHATSNAGISAASNAAVASLPIEVVKVAFLDQDDLLHRFAVGVVRTALVSRPNLRLLYSDEDRIGDGGVHHSGHFKTSWNPYLLYSCNYINHLTVIDRASFDKVGGFRSDFDGSQDWDLLLRVTLGLDAEEIGHLPYVLYHWRDNRRSYSTRSETRGRTLDAGRRCVEAALGERGRSAAVVTDPLTGHNIVRFRPNGTPKVSVIIPFRDNAVYLRRCVSSLRTRTEYPEVEVVLVDNQSSDPATVELMRHLESEGARLLHFDRPFNYSALNNWAVSHVDAELLCFLNDDTEVVAPGWLDDMVGVAQYGDVGAVGAKLLYGDGTVQHGGVALGLRGTAGHLGWGLGGNEPGYFNRARLLQEVTAVTAACLVVRREAFMAVGGFDEEHLAVAFNDIDLCLKLNAAGLRNLYVPTSVLHHFESKSRGHDFMDPSKKRRVEIEGSVMEERYGDVIWSDPFLNPNVSLGDLTLVPSDLPRLGEGVVIR